MLIRGLGTLDANNDLKVIATLPGLLKEDVKAFLESIPAELTKIVNQVCTDMYDGYVAAAIEVFGVQSLVIDRYHVSKLYRKPLDQLRTTEMSRLKSTMSRITLSSYF